MGYILVFVLGAMFGAFVGVVVLAVVVVGARADEPMAPYREGQP